MDPVPEPSRRLRDWPAGEIRTAATLDLPQHSEKMAPMRRLSLRRRSAATADPHANSSRDGQLRAERDHLRTALHRTADRARQAEDTLAREVAERQAAQYDARRLERRRKELARAVQQAASAVAEVRADLVRVRASRTWRMTHGVLIALRLLRGSPPRRHTSALDVSLTQLADLEAQLVRSPPRSLGGPPPQTRPSAARYEHPTPPAASGSATDAGNGKARAGLPSPPVPRVRTGRLLDMGEELGRLNFRRRYELTIGPSGAPGAWADPSFPDPVDWGEAARCRPTAGANRRGRCAST